MKKAIAVGDTVKIYTSILLLSLGILHMGCGGDNSSVKHTPEQVIAAEGFSQDTINGVYKHYTGTIAGQSVVLHYMQYGPTITGQYYYSNIGNNINLYNVPEQTNGMQITFMETPMTEKDERSSTWHVMVKGDSLIGTWTSADSTTSYPILLQENYSNGVQQFGVICMADSLRYNDSMPLPAADVSYQLLLPLGNDSATLFVRNTICNSIGCPGADSRILKECLDELKEKYKTEYRAAIATDSFDLNTSFNNWSQMTNMWVMYNDDGMLVLNHHIYDYTGGAHGNYGSKYLCLDTRIRKVLRSEDIIGKNADELIPILEKEVRKTFEIADEQALNEYLLTEEMFVPEQFYLTSKGITFSYGIYELGPYAMGEINVFIPYTKITHLLTPYFTERMHLQPATAKN